MKTLTIVANLERNVVWFSIYLDSKLITKACSMMTISQIISQG